MDGSYRLLALDIDGTLLNRSGVLLESTARAVKRAHEKGIRPVLCTGRRHRRACTVAEELGLDAPLICHSGAIVKSVDGRRTLWRADLPSAILRAVLEQFHDARHPALSFRDTPPHGHDFVTDAYPSGQPDLDEYLECNRDHAEIDPSWRLRVDDEPHFHICAFGDRDRMLEFQNVLDAHLGEGIKTFVQKSPSYRGTMCEVLRGDAGKWTAVMQVAELWGIAPSEIIAVGDDMNDLPMIASAGLGVAMGHAPKSVRAAADIVVGDHDHDGVTHLIEQVLGI